MNLPRCRYLIAVLPLLFAANVRGEEPKLPAELAWIPQNSTAFVHIRFAELWNSPVGRDVAKIIREVDPKGLDELEKNLGFPLSRLDRVTVLLPSATEEGREPGFVFRLTTTRPYNRRDVLTAFKAKSLNEGPEKAAPNGDFFRADDRMLIHLTDERNLTLFSSNEGAIGLLGRMLSAKKTGPLGPALTLAAGKNQVAASVSVAQLPRIPVDQLPAEFAPLRALLEAKTITAVGNLGTEASQVDVTVTFGNKEDADEGTQAIEAGRKLLLTFLSEAEQHIDREQAGKLQLELIKEVKNTVKAAKIEQTGPTVRVSAQLRVSATVAKILAEGTGAIRMSSARIKSQNNLKQIGLALHNYHDVNGAFPPAAICDKNGKPLLSWRVAILPYIEQDNIYRQLHLDEPWDSDHNKKLLDTVIPTYVLPTERGVKDRKLTFYQVLVGNDAMFELRRGTRLAQVTDGLSNTLMVVESAEGVPWSKPDDISYDPKKTPPLGYHFGNTCNALFGDGSVRALKKSMDEKILHLLIQKSDGQVIPNIP